MSVDKHTLTQAGTDPYRHTAYAWYAVLVFTLIQTCNIIDRSIVGLVIEPIKVEFRLSDSDVGALTGLAFGATYAIFSLVYATVIHRINRRVFLAMAVAGWSLCTLVTAHVQSTWALFAARLGLGAFESGGSPTMMSMIPDIIERERRSTALGIYFLSGALGVLLSFFIGGHIIAAHGWRTLYIAASIPGFLLAVFVILSVREPVRGAKDDAVPDMATPTGLLPALRYIIQNRNTWMLLLALTLAITASSAVGVWIASFLRRMHDLPIATVGMWIALAFGVCGGLGSAVCGWLGDRLARRHAHWHLTLSTILLSASLVIGIAMSATETAVWAIGLLCVFAFFGLGYMPPLYSVWVSRSPTEHRGAMMYVMTIGTNTIGYGMGPWLLGVLSDLYGGPSSLRWASVTILLLNGVAAVILIAVNTCIHGDASLRSAAGSREA